MRFRILDENTLLEYLNVSKIFITIPELMVKYRCSDATIRKVAKILLSKNKIKQIYIDRIPAYSVIDGVDLPNVT